MEKLSMTFFRFSVNILSASSAAIDDARYYVMHRIVHTNYSILVNVASLTGFSAI